MPFCAFRYTGPTAATLALWDFFFCGLLIVTQSYLNQADYLDRTESRNRNCRSELLLSLCFARFRGLSLLLADQRVTLSGLGLSANGNARGIIDNITIAALVQDTLDILS